MKDINEFEGLYRANENGTIISLPRWCNAGCNGYMKKERIMKSSPDKDGYLHLVLRKNDKAFTRSVHRLMAQTFIPNPLNLPEVNHKNGIKTDNRVENLEWCTSLHNVSHAVETGLRNTKGIRHGRHKLTESQVLEIRELASSMRGVDIAKLYGVGKVCISQIIHRKSWNHI